jgi:hypothetical protein
MERSMNRKLIAVLVLSLMVVRASTGSKWRFRLRRWNRSHSLAFSGRVESFESKPIHQTIISHETHARTSFC